jgi:single-stranded-DNA-specific exonuclease
VSLVPSDDGISVSALTRKLFPDTADIAARFHLSVAPPGDAWARETLRSCNGWESVHAVLRRVVDESIPTLVYSDYDVDGVTAAFLMYRWLRSRDVPGNVFLPSRQRHGYGLNMEIINQAEAQGYGALIALDCGTANVAEIAEAQRAGLVCAVIDHHESHGELPVAPLLNPHSEQTLAPFCTTGLVYTLLAAIQDEFGITPVGDELELAGLATLADVVPLTPENWQLAHHGLRALPETLNFGLSALIKSSRLHGLTRLTARQALFSLVPRLNAAGRMRSAHIALDLLQAKDSQSAREIAALLEQLNDERRQCVDRVAREALLQASGQAPKNGVVLYGADWHVGVLGIVAARVAEQLSMPAVVLADDPTMPGLLAGSARTARGVDLVASMGQCAEYLASYGGHAAAAGVKLQREQLKSFQGTWESATAAAAVVTAQDVITARYPRFAISELTQSFEDEIWRLAPFGTGFAAPRGVLSDVRVERVSLMGRDKTHLSLQVGDGERQLRVVGFNLSHLRQRLELGTRVSLAVEFEADNWNNRYSVMLMLVGIADDDGETRDRQQC